MLLQVLSLTSEQINALPADQKAGVMQLASRLFRMNERRTTANEYPILIRSGHNSECDRSSLFDLRSRDKTEVDPAHS
jgi:hypothetical protein